jgi:hypothetical protein
MILRKEFSSVYLVNLTDENGRPEWPERYSLADIKRIHTENDPFTLKREYYNTPVEEGKIFKAEWLVFRKAKKLSEYPLLLGHWDLSYKKEGDFKAMALLGFDAKGLIVLDIFCRKCDIADAVTYHYNLLRRLRSEAAMPIFLYDATAAQEDVFRPVFEQESIRQKIYELPMPDRTATVDKYLRIEATLTNVFFNKSIAFADHLKGTPDYKAGEEQILGFEKGSHMHDDFPDTLEAAVRLINKYAWSDTNEQTFKPRIVKRKRGGF